MNKSNLLQIVSDVHLEFYNKVLPKITKHAPYLALLGDIGKPFSASYRDFLWDQSRQFEKVFVLMGNHEYYHRDADVPSILKRARDVCAEMDNVHLLERDTYELSDNTVLLGCTLWSDISDAAAHGMNDFKNIHANIPDKTKSRWRFKLKPEMYRFWHWRDVNWIQTTLDELQKNSPEKKAMVLTHHAPHELMAGKYYGSELSSGFSTDLTRLFRPPVICFANGHVHSNCDINVNGIRCVSNALGYPGELTGFKDVTVEFRTCQDGRNVEVCAPSSPPRTPA